MENVNQIRFDNSYAIGNFASKQSQKKEESKDNTLAESSKNQVSVNPEDVLNAMNIAGSQKMLQVNSPSKEVNPLEHLSSERIADIEAMMDEFDNGVKEVSDFLTEEFPGISETDKNTLAAAVFARE